MKVCSSYCRLPSFGPERSYKLALSEEVGTCLRDLVL